MFRQNLRSVLEIIIFQLPLSIHVQLLFVNIICLRVIMANRPVTAHVEIARLLFFYYLYYYIGYSLLLY